MIQSQEQDNGLVFFSYTTADRERVLSIYDQIKTRDFNVWMDKKNIKGGQNWDFEIKRALDRAQIILLFVSSNSFQKRGYIQREIKVVLDKLEEKLIDDIYIIPIMLEEMDVPEQIKHIQYINSKDINFIDQISESIIIQLQRLGIKKIEAQSQSQISWNIINFKEEWDGLPGYDISVDMIFIESKIYKNLNNIAILVNSKSVDYILLAHSKKFDQDTNFFNHAQHKYQKTDIYEINIIEPIIKQGIISILISISLYGAGAAHPNQIFSSYSFVLEPLIKINRLIEIFKNATEAEEFLNRHIKSEFTAKFGKEMVEQLGLGEEMHFSHSDNFIFKEDSIEIIYDENTGFPHAMGVQFIDLKYSDIAHLLKMEYVNALGLEKEYYDYMHQLNDNKRN